MADWNNGQELLEHAASLGAEEGTAYIAKVFEGNYQPKLLIEICQAAHSYQGNDGWKEGTPRAIVDILTHIKETMLGGMGG